MINLTHKMSLAARVCRRRRCSRDRGRARARPRLRVTTARLLPSTRGSSTRKLKHGVLTIEGTKGDDTIVLRLQADRPDVLQVDVGDARKHPFHFKREGRRQHLPRRR